MYVQNNCVLVLYVSMLTMCNHALLHCYIFCKQYKSAQTVLPLEGRLIHETIYTHVKIMKGLVSIDKLHACIRERMIDYNNILWQI